MKKLLCLAAMFVSALLPAFSQETYITPSPKSISYGTGHFTLPRKYSVSLADFTDGEMKKEATQFVGSLDRTTGYKGKLKKGTKGTFVLLKDSTIESEGYQMDITPRRVTIKVSTTAGLFYAFQSVRQMLPPHVMAGLACDTVAAYRLPVASIDDAPRFSYRGFMLDCGRHFFTVQDIKHVLDGMAMYKLNYFHWHLTEDQGWRFEVKKYPRLTEIGSVASDCRWNDMEKGYYWLGHQYGPYFYTQDQCREIVRYADSLHIQVIPEIDMPGHICAALASYPEFSCDPKAEHKVQTNQGGVYSDVLNVGNPAAVQFARDVLTEVMDVFPCEYVHIGGDECPSTAWEHNQQCQQLLQSLIAKGITPAQEKPNCRPLQSYFITQMAEHLKQRGRKMALWNESVTAHGADLNLIKQTGATIFCWHPCQQGARTAASLGLDCIITEYGPGCYYINRKQSDAPGEPGAAGSGKDNLEMTFRYVPVPESVPANQRHHYKGVQGTFWTEHVCDISYVDYLAYPRLIAIAETGWSPLEKPGFDDFLRRFRHEAGILQMRGFNFGKHYLPQESK